MHVARKEFFGTPSGQKWVQSKAARFHQRSSTSWLTRSSGSGSARLSATTRLPRGSGRRSGRFWRRFTQTTDYCNRGILCASRPRRTSLSTYSNVLLRKIWAQRDSSVHIVLRREVGPQGASRKLIAADVARHAPAGVSLVFPFAHHTSVIDLLGLTGSYLPRNTYHRLRLLGVGFKASTFE